MGFEIEEGETTRALSIFLARKNFSSQLGLVTTLGNYRLIRRTVNQALIRTIL